MKRNATIIRPSEKNRFGDDVGSPTEFLDTSPWVLSVASASDTATASSFNGQRNSETLNVTAYVLGPTKVETSDLVRIDGFVWQVDGSASRAESPFSGRLAGHMVSLKQYLG